MVCSLNSQGRSVLWCLDTANFLSNTNCLSLCGPNMRLMCPWNEKKRVKWKKNAFIRVAFERICVSVLCSDPLTSMKFIRFFHDNHIFHRFSFNKRYSLAHTCIHLALPYRKMYMSEMVFECRATEKKKQTTNAPAPQWTWEVWRNEKRKNPQTRKITHIRDSFAPISTWTPLLINNPNARKAKAFKRFLVGLEL